MFTDREFRDVMGSYATGVTVATAALQDGRKAGLTVNSFTSVSLTPPLVLFCLGAQSQAYDVFSQATGFAINILRDNQQDISSAFAKSGQSASRWEGLEWETWGTGAPILRSSLASLDCKTVAQHSAGDHVIFVGQVLQLAKREGLPLLYWSSGYQHI